MPAAATGLSPFPGAVPTGLVSNWEGLAAGLLLACLPVGGTEPDLEDVAEALPAGAVGDEAPSVRVGLEPFFNADFLSTDISFAWNKVKIKGSPLPLAGSYISYSIGL